ncbi:MAG: ABC transporter permease subunit [Verrucomicrobiota bacterium]
MENILDLSRWRECPRGLLYRIWVIARNGLQFELRTRLFRWLLAASWFWGVSIAVLCLLFNQSFTTDSWLQNLGTHFGPRIGAALTASKAIVLLFPDVWIGGFFTLILRAHSVLALLFSLVALTALVPRLITRDRASNALTLYLSRPLTSMDYLLGKFGVIVGILGLLWSAPLVLGWILSMAFAPDRDFVAYSLPPLLRALTFNAIALVSISCLALGVSACSRSSRNAVLLWVGLWMILGTVANSPKTPTLLRLSSFSYDLTEVRTGLFQTESVLRAVADIPLLPSEVVEKLNQSAKRSDAPNFKNALCALALMCVVSSVAFFRKLRAE